MGKNLEYDNFKERGKQFLANSGKKNFKINPPGGTFRVLKTPKGTKSPSVFFQFAVHENVGPEKRYVRCGIDPISGKGSCFICQKLIPKLRKSGKETRAAGLEPKEKMVVQVAAVDKKDKMTGPFIFYPAKRVGESLISTIIMSKKRDYVDHKRGYNISLSRTGTGQKDTRYGSLEADEESSKVPSEIIDKLKPFDELTDIPQYSEDKQKKAYYGENADFDDEEEDKKKKKSSRDDDDEDEDEDEEDDSDEDDDEDDDEPKSKKKSIKKKKAKDDDDDDDDDGDSDEDEDDDDEDDDEDEDDDSDDEDEDDDEDSDDDDDEDDEPVKKKKKVLKKKRK